MGKLKEGYEEVEYSIEASVGSLFGGVCGVVGGSVRSKLSSIALKHSLKCESVIRVVVPHSLLGNLPSETGELFDLNAIVQREVVHEWIHEIFSRGVGSDFSYIAIPSIGNIQNKDAGFVVRYHSDVTTIHFLLFAQLVKDFLTNKGSPFIAVGDISTGLNIYIYPLIEAFRSFQVFTKLYNFIQSNRNVELGAFISSCDPILGKTTPPYKITLSPVDVKAFFSMPTRDKQQFSNPTVWFSYHPLEERGENWKRKISTEWLCLGKHCKAVLSAAFALLNMSFNAIDKNAPLFFYYLAEDDLLSCGSNPEIAKILLNPENIDRLILRLAELTIAETTKFMVKRENGCVDIKYTRLNGKIVINVFFGLAMLRSIMKFYRDEILPTHHGAKSVELDVILNTFSKLYDTLKLDLNKTYLQREITNIKQGIEKLFSNKVETTDKKDKKQCGEYLEVEPCSGWGERKPKSDGKESSKQGELVGDGRKGSNVKRNFFAHSGMSKTVTCVEEDGTIRWKKERLREICSWLNS